eukprot:4926927-Prymnesium_polylepis.1
MTKWCARTLCAHNPVHFPSTCVRFPSGAFRSYQSRNGETVWSDRPRTPGGHGDRGHVGLVGSGEVLSERLCPFLTDQDGHHVSRGGGLICRD